MAPASKATGRRDASPFIGILIPIFGAALILFSRWQKHARALGLNAQAAARTLGASTTRRAVWSRPEVAALLLPEGVSRGASSPAPATAAGLAAAVSAIANGLPEPARALGAQAHAAARDLADAVASLDKQIAGLAKAFDPAEAKRLVEKLAVLGLNTGPDDENREAREILQRQLDTVRSLEARIEDAKSRRAKRFELLKALWLQALDLQAAAGDAARTGHTTDRIKKLFAQIEEQAGGPKANRADGGNTEPISEAPTIAR